MSLDTDIARLSRVPLFSILGTSALRLLAFAAESYPFARGDFLFRQGDTADGSYLIVSGAVELLHHHEREAEPGVVANPGPTDGEPDGHERIVGPGTLLGEQALLAETLRPVSARAAKPTSTLKITRSMFARVLREYPASAQAIRQIWARRLHERLTAE